MCIQIPECPPATVAEQHEGTLSASGFDVKFILFQLLGTLVNYLTRILEYRFPCYPIDGGNLWQTKFYSMEPMASLHSSILARGSTFWRICRSGNFVNFIKITATDLCYCRLWRGCGWKRSKWRGEDLPRALQRMQTGAMGTRGRARDLQPPSLIDGGNLWQTKFTVCRQYAGTKGEG